MKVLSVTSECVPLIKTGGLADVAGALPGALDPEGIAVTTLLPGYPQVMKALKDPKVRLKRSGFFGGTARVLSGTAQGLDLMVLDAPHLFQREGPIYLGPDGRDWPDNPERFAALSYAAALIGRDGFDLVHCHDWQAGLAPYYLRATDIPTVLTIHNVAFHGLAPADKLDALELEADDFTQDGFEFWGQISALKAGLIWATKLTTVSPTYADELLRPEFGMGLDGVIRSRSNDLSGILNGIDTEVWDPSTDPLITPYTTPAGKKRNKAALRKIMGLPDADGPLCVVISRLTEQKGLDLLIQALPSLLGRGGQLALLGSGSADLEYAFHNAAGDRNVAVRIGYDEPLSHKMIAGGDAIIIPSRFEPCGLTQLYGLRYGTVPLVTLTGGLADTVINASPAALARAAATGIQVHPTTADALARGLSQLCDLWEAPKTWATLQKNAMKQPVGWDNSAKAYASLYRGLKA